MHCCGARCAHLRSAGPADGNARALSVFYMFDRSAALSSAHAVRRSPPTTALLLRAVAQGCLLVLSPRPGRNLVYLLISHGIPVLILHTANAIVTITASSATIVKQ